MTSIQNNIIQIHRSYDILTPFERVAIERWRALNPDWNYVFLTDADIDEYILETWPEYRKAYTEVMEPIQRAQVQRLAAVHLFGGVYADCDVYPIRPLKRILGAASQLVLPVLKPHPNLGNADTWGDYFFAGVKGHTFFDDVVVQIFERSFTEEALLLAEENWALYIYETAGIHLWSEMVGDYKFQSAAGCDVHIEDIRSTPEKCNLFHYSVESWIPGNRFQRDGKDLLEDSMLHLNVLKEIYGV